MCSPFRSRWLEPSTNTTEADNTNTMSPYHFDSQPVSPSTPATNRAQDSDHWCLEPHAQFEQEPTTLSPSTTPRRRRTSARKINTPIVRTTRCGSIQKPKSSDRLADNFSILSLNRPKTSTPHSSPTSRRFHDTELDEILTFTSPEMQYGYGVLEMEKAGNAECVVSPGPRCSRSPRFEPYSDPASPSGGRRGYRRAPTSYDVSSPRLTHPYLRTRCTLLEVLAMEQAEEAIRNTAITAVDETDASSDYPTAQDSLIVSPSPSSDQMQACEDKKNVSDDAEYTSDSETTISSTAYTPPPSNRFQRSTSGMSLDCHRCCWMTGENPIMCTWESLSHEDLWQHVMCEHFIEIFRDRFLCGWVHEAGRGLCGIGTRSLEEMRDHVIEHVRNEGGRVG